MMTEMTQLFSAWLGCSGSAYEWSPLQGLTSLTFVRAQTSPVYLVNDVVNDINVQCASL